MLIEPAQLLLFVAAGWLLNLTPGPDVLYAAGHALRHGRRAGFVAVAGILAGCLMHVVVAALGLGLLLATSAMLFNAVKWIGAAYLCWIGLTLLRTPSAPGVRAGEGDGAEGAPVPLIRVFAGGFLANALNPKVVLFFLAFLPQFIGPQVEDKALAFALLGLLFTLNSVPVLAGYVLLADWTRRSALAARSMRWLDRVAGVLFIGFGLRLVTAARPGQ